ncbi:hypothetical protein NitYY0826_C0485 [Nitratiruptor sp. YY08-26]|uniref:hypothetical protein n=1 Tax=unclassified Nitratiruptor TaxID=2624044 RepID=UPI0019167FC1|nr:MULTISPECIES: hypothetical protein [unclassified Nitratiruptor]BCD61626.1 hypothetical protein NitYY0813_C0484 [Nitratiruptor sp. YY08-13]BCD65560.1 hypothetical protein NitYY0826_C0485 [Nitratiruptor sp. YY08-26]
MQLSTEGLLTQLGYHPDDSNIRQLEAIQKATPGFEQIQKHIVALNDHLKNYGGFVAMSNSHPYFKIKIEATEPSAIEVAKNEISKWADKYNVKLQKVENKETYYILGVEK